MSILKVARMGHPVLRSRARALDPSEVRAAVFQKFIDDMMDTMLEYEGIGLAAPQVHEGVRLFVAGLDEGAGKMRVLPFVNPKGKPFSLELEGFQARVVQHETDHLDGVLFFDRMERFDSLTFLEEFSRYHRKSEAGDEEDE